jgi:hypothetical protein
MRERLKHTGDDRQNTCRYLVHAVHHIKMSLLTRRALIDVEALTKE